MAVAGVYRALRKELFQTEEETENNIHAEKRLNLKCLVKSEECGVAANIPLYNVCFLFIGFSKYI